MRAVGVVLALGVALAWAQVDRERALVVDEIVSLPAGEWRFAPVLPSRSATTVQSEFAVLSGNGVARVAILRQRDLERHGSQYRDHILKATRYGRAGRLVARVDAGAYAVVLDGQEKAHETISVRLRVWFDPGRRGRELPPARRWAVVILSLTVFAAICVFVFWKLRPKQANRRHQF